MRCWRLPWRGARTQGPQLGQERVGEILVIGRARARHVAGDSGIANTVPCGLRCRSVDRPLGGERPTLRRPALAAFGNAGRDVILVA
eukprot:15436373-Alexandrium_andersonii.AAC.1